MQSWNNCEEVVTIACHLKSHFQMLAALFQDLKEICILMVAGSCGLVCFNSRPGHWKDRKGTEKPVDAQQTADSEDPRPNKMKPLLSLRVLDSRVLNGRSNRFDEHSYRNVHEALRHQRTRETSALMTRARLRSQRKKLRTGKRKIQISKIKYKQPVWGSFSGQTDLPTYRHHVSLFHHVHSKSRKPSDKKSQSANSQHRKWSFASW